MAGKILSFMGICVGLASLFVLLPTGLKAAPIGGGVGQVPSVGTQRGDENYFLGRVDYRHPPRTHSSPAT